MSMKKMLAVVAAASLVAVAAPAFAANPFSDVPMNHWAYDAVEQMAAKGILEGYPNGTFKGNRAMTRYEIAQMVARMMANGVGGADADKLKALIVEFAPELEALGVKVDGFDGRLSKLEKGVGGWRLWGQGRFDFTNTKSKTGDEETKSHGFKFNRHRLFLRKELSDKVSVDFRWNNGKFDRYFVTAKDFLGWNGLTFRAGQFNIDWMGDDGLYYGNSGAAGVGGSVGADAGWVMPDVTYRGVHFVKTFGFGEVNLFAASDYGAGGLGEKNFDLDGYGTRGGEYYGARLKFNFGEKFWLSGNMYIEKPGDGKKFGTYKYTDSLGVKHTLRTIEDVEGATLDRKYYWVGAGTNFKGLQLKGAYMWMKDGYNAKTKDHDLDGNAWKIILDVSQDVLKFTNLWVEFQKREKEFLGTHDEYFASFSPKHLYDADSKVLVIGARQQWSKKFNTFERYTQVKYDGSDDLKNSYGKDKEWVIGMGYTYSPNLYFELSYNKIDYDYAKLDGAKAVDQDDKIIRFRTILNF